MNRYRQLLSVLAFTSSIALSVYAQDTGTPDRPGRATPEKSPASVEKPAQTSPPPPQAPLTPDRPGRVRVTDVTTEPDEDFLRDTAGALGVRPPAQRPDEWLLRWGGVRPELEAHGITFAGAWTADYSRNFQGGLDSNADAFRNLFDARFNVDTRAAFGWHGGTFSIDFQNQAGVNGSDKVGDVQGFDNADADGRTQIAELWYEQLLFDNKLRIKVGKVDANSEFALPAFAGGFLNSSFGHPPTITAMPTYPDPATSLNVFVYPAPWFYAGFGVYDGSNAVGVETGAYGPARLFHSGHTLFTIGEAGVRWRLRDNTLPGRFAVGAHYSDARYTRFDGSEQSGAGGVYAIAEQKLWHKKFYDKTSDDGLYGFLQYGHADRRVSDVSDYVGAGLSFVGPYTKVNPDSLGIGVAAARLSDDRDSGFTESWETSVEAYYNFQVTRYLSVKPDLQYIVHPGGQRDVNDALVATVRVTLAF